MPIAQLMRLLLLLGCVLALNTTGAGRLGFASTIFINALAVILTLGVGFWMTKIADEDLGPASFFGLPRSRRLLFSAFGGYFVSSVLGIIGAEMVLSGNRWIPFALRMPDTSLLTISTLSWLISLLTISKIYTHYRARFFAGTGVVVLTLLATFLVFIQQSQGTDLFRIVCSTYLLIAWPLILWGNARRN